MVCPCNSSYSFYGATFLFLLNAMRTVLVYVTTDACSGCSVSIPRVVVVIIYMLYLLCLIDTEEEKFDVLMIWFM